MIFRNKLHATLPIDVRLSSYHQSNTQSLNLKNVSLLLSVFKVFDCYKFTPYFFVCASMVTILVNGCVVCTNLKASSPEQKVFYSNCNGILSRYSCLKVEESGNKVVYSAYKYYNGARGYILNCAANETANNENNLYALYVHYVHT